MSVATTSRFLALLALTANVATIAVLVLGVMGRVSSRAGRARDVVVAASSGSSWWLAFAVATTSTLGSLYFSEVAGFVPCTLCWYQRIAMYPMVVLFGVAAWRRDHGIRPYVAVLAVVGGLISVYHYTLQWFPGLDSGSCSTGVPCTTAYVRVFGFVSIPYMALSGFALILAILWLDRRDNLPATAS